MVCYVSSGDGVLSEQIYRSLRTVCVQLHSRTFYKHSSRRISTQSAVAVMVGLESASRLFKIGYCIVNDLVGMHGNFHCKGEGEG